MADYSKWDSLADSDEERESKQRAAETLEADESDRQRQDQEEVEQWLRKQVAQLQRTEEPQRPPELKELMPYRKTTKDERKVLAQLLVVSYFEEGKTNLDRHPQMLELARHHRWLEEDPGTMELLCRVHNQVMKAAGEGAPKGAETASADARMRNMCLCAINTLAAPKIAKCSGGLLELVTLICTPPTERARELRVKWQKKEFAKDAIFDSLFPDLRQHAEESGDMGMKEIWVCLAIVALLLIVMLLMFYSPGVAPTFGRSPRPTPAPAPPPPIAHQRPAAGEL